MILLFTKAKSPTSIGMPHLEALDSIDREALKTWLQKQKPEVSVVIAARIALRALPLAWLAPPVATAAWEDKLVLPVFRAAAVAWAVAKYPEQAKSIREYANEAAAAGAHAAGYAAGFASVAETAAADIAAAAVDAAATAASLVAFDALDAESNFPAIHHSREAAAATDADIEAVRSGRSAKQIANRRLWPQRHPETMTAWAEMKTGILAQSENHFEVWTSWYEARLAGRRTNDPLELARVMIRDDIWVRGPAVVNAEIKQLILDHSPGPRESERTTLKQRPAGFTFRVTDDIYIARLNARPKRCACASNESRLTFTCVLTSIG